MRLGKIDSPVERLEQDKLSVDAQIKGFADFILHCETPMAVAIQGAWGSGKTSFVNMVMDAAREVDPQAAERCGFLAFNVWQYSQFGMGKQLAVSLLTALIGELRKGMPQDSQRGSRALEELSRGLRTLGKFSLGIANDIVKKTTDIDVKSHLDTVVREYSGKSGEEADAIGELRHNFQVAIDERLKGLAGTDGEEPRLVLFLDDLDRLPPDRAIEILEVLKLFLDCPNCVFLLAIDYDVVVNGVTIKYKGTLNAEKGKDFFEKMIQVVYNMPRSLDHTDRYIAAMLAENGMNRAMAVDFAKLLKAAGKDNPRSIKRFVNSYLLLARMKRYVSPMGELEEDVALFAVLCLQSVCPEVYDWLAANLEELPMDRLNALKDLALQDESSGEEPTPQFLLRLGLTDSQGTRVFSRWEFLRTFFAQIVECDWDGPEEMGNFDYAAPLGAAHEKIIRSAIRLAQLTRAEDGSITEDDCVAFLIADCEYWPTRTGSVGEAFALSCQYLLRGLETEQAVEAASYFPFLSEDPTHLANPYDLHYPGAALYVDQDWPAREVTARLEDLISYVREWDNSPVFLVWFKDKAGQQELWSYRSPLGEEDPEENFSFDLNLDEF